MILDFPSEVIPMQFLSCGFHLICKILCIFSPAASNNKASTSCLQFLTVRAVGELSYVVDPSSKVLFVNLNTLIHTYLCPIFCMYQIIVLI